ncbi:MAG: hypothetical protein QM751_08575 [Paludibacteraceae bacterium]
MEPTKSLHETLDGMKLSVRYSIDNINDVMCIWESGDTQSNEAMTIILHRRIDFEYILSKSSIPKMTLSEGLKIYLEDSKDIFNKLEKIINEDYSDLQAVCFGKRGKILTKRFGF